MDNQFRAHCRSYKCKSKKVKTKKPLHGFKEKVKTKVESNKKKERLLKFKYQNYERKIFLLLEDHK
jgi:hypothetical protein